MGCENPALAPQEPTAMEATAAPNIPPATDYNDGRGRARVPIITNVSNFNEE